MYEDLNSKIQILNSFDQKHLAVLNALMADKDFKLPTLANQLGYQVSTVRNFLTDIYKACGVPESEEDKRGYIVREYSEAYLKKDQIPSEPPKPEEIPQKEEEKTVIEPRITITPAQPRVNPRLRGLLTVGIIVVVGVVVISVLLSILQGLNSPFTPTNYDSFNPEPTTAYIPLKTGEHDWYSHVYFADGLAFMLDGFTDTCPMQIWIENGTDSRYTKQFKASDFKLTDEQGTNYTLVAFQVDQIDYPPDVLTVSVNPPYREPFSLCFEPERIPDNARYIYLTFKGIQNGNDMTYRYENFR